ncbi:MAG: arylsulfotransferase family protein, partial [Sphingomicrobium sp.]
MHRINMLADRDNPARTEKTDRIGLIPRILFSRVELWVVLLVLIVGSTLAVCFGAAVLEAERKKEGLGFVSRTALAVAEIPLTAKSMLHAGSRFRVWSTDRYKSQPTGWSFPSGPMTRSRGYLLLSRFDGSEYREKLELVAMPSMRTVYSWPVNGPELLQRIMHRRSLEPISWEDGYFDPVHPVLEENGDLIVKKFFAAIRVNACGKPLWTLQDVAYHHSIEPDAEGNLWLPSTPNRPSVAPVSEKFQDNRITEISPSGKLLLARSVAQILLRHGYANWLFSIPYGDPMHLNDIQPVLADGPYWKKGDLFLSLRNLSTIMLYRPSTDEIVWFKRGPWIAQHDVDILDDHRISVYDNDAQARTSGTPFIASSSQVMVYDFATGKISLPLQRAMNDNGVKTLTEGLFTQLPDGSALIQDPNEGRLLIFRADGAIAAQYINRAKDGWLYHLG